MQDFGKERPHATVHVTAVHGFNFREYPTYIATVIAAAMQIFFFFFFVLQLQIATVIATVMFLAKVSWGLPLVIL